MTTDGRETLAVFMGALAIIAAVFLTGLVVISTTSSIVLTSIAEGVVGVSCVVALDYALERDWLP